MNTEKNTLQTPITTDAETIIRVLDSSKYMPGQPRDYRFNCKDGAIYRSGEKIAETATLHVLAYRIVEGKLFGKNTTWIELFFIDDEGKVGSTLFNSHSAEEFQRFLSDLYYEELTLPEAVITIRFNKKMGSQNGEPYTYHILSFALQNRVDFKAVSTIEKFTKNRHLYRADTLVPLKEITAVNFYAKPQKASSTVVAHPATVETPAVTA